GAFQNLFQSV
nr:Chain B, small peptide [synthetic construct]